MDSTSMRKDGFIHDLSGALIAPAAATSLATHTAWVCRTTRGRVCRTEVRAVRRRGVTAPEPSLPLETIGQDHHKNPQGKGAHGPFRPRQQARVGCRKKVAVALGGKGNTTEINGAVFQRCLLPCSMPC
jgi:hypothetical protein